MANELQHWVPEHRWYDRMVCAVVIKMSAFVMKTLNSVVLENAEEWKVLTKANDKSLLTYSNHVSLFDDPLVTASLGLSRYEDVRWIGADHKNFFNTRLKGLIFSAGQCVPIIRGGGLKQVGFDFLQQKLKAGSWVHMFPEGTRTRDPDALMKPSFKLGIGRWLAEAKPLTMPFYHYGMHQVLPIGNRLPNRGNTVTVRFGPAQRVTDEWLQENNFAGDDQKSNWESLAQWSYEQLRKLERELHPNPGPERTYSPG